MSIQNEPKKETQGGFTMTDIVRTASLIEMSSKLQTASYCLKKLSAGAPPSEREKKDLKWTANLLVQIDWQTKPSGKLGDEVGMAVQAATTRPTFYESLLKVRPRFKSVGINSGEEVIVFLKQLYSTLSAGGSKSKLSEEKKILASEFLEVLSHSIISELNNNGLPRDNDSVILGTIS